MKRPFSLSLVMPLGLSLLCISAVSFFAETKTLTSNITAALSEKGKALVEADSARLQEIFKDIHQNPELAFMETRTAEMVANELRALGFEVKTGIAKTGVVGILKNGEGPTVMYRADMDANAVEEATGLPWASSVRVKREDGVEVPVAHMCGHDAHTTWMLGIAKALVELKSEWSGTFIAVAQPAEELILGAQAMLDDGLYTHHGVPVPDYLIGLHTAPGPVGIVISAPGVRMAGTDQLDVVFHGRGGHGSRPHETKDPVIMAANAVVQYQNIVSRILDPMQSAVLTVGSIQAGTDNNVIPESALLKLNLRFFDLTTRKRMIESIKSINDGIANTYRVGKDRMPTVTMKGFSPPLVNDPDLIARLNRSFFDLVGEKKVWTDFPAVTGSEDFHILAGDHKDVKIAYLFVGIADPAEVEAAQKQGNLFPFAAHSPFYKVDLSSIPFGTQVGLNAVLEVMAKKGAGK
jgi:hippurate hydrolase